MTQTDHETQAPRTHPSTSGAKKGVDSALPRLRGLFLRRGALPRGWPLALGVALGAACGAGYGLVATPEYSATGYVVAVPGEGGDPATALGFAQAYGRVATSPAVLADAQRTSGVPLATLRDTVRSATSPDAPMIEITGTASHPQRAAAHANAVAAALTDSSKDAAKNTGVELTVLATAHAPSAPSSPSTPLATAVGVCTGGLVGGLALLVRPGRRSERPAAVPAQAPVEPEPESTEHAPLPAAAEPAQSKKPAASSPRRTDGRTRGTTRRKASGSKTPVPKASASKAPGSKTPVPKASASKTPGSRASGPRASGSKASGSKASEPKAPGSRPSAPRASAEEAQGSRETPDHTPAGDVEPLHQETVAEGAGR